MFSASQARHANYVCAALAIIILLTRLTVARLQKKKLDAGTYLIVASILVIIARLVVNFYYLRLGTASDAINNARYFDTHNRRSIMKGTILSLSARILITASCWLQIGLLLLFYWRVMYTIRWVVRLIKVCWLVTIVTFMAVVLANFLECRPFHLYWQISPDPGTCVRAYIQLLIQCISNIVIDIILLIISYPLLLCKGRSWGQHFRVGTLFILGTFCIIVTVLRLKSVYATKSAQVTRSLWASVQVVVSAFVANVPTIYGDLKVVQRKRSEPLARRVSGAETWNSDKDHYKIEQRSSIRVPEQVAPGTLSRSRTKEGFDHVESQL